MRSHFPLLTLLALISAGSSFADTVGLTYNSSCTLEGFPTVVGNQTCSNDPTGHGTTNYVPGVPVFYSTINISSSGPTSFSSSGNAYGIGQSTPNSIYTGLYDAGSQGTYSTNLTTAGPVRAGFLKATISYEGTQAAESPDFAGSYLTFTGGLLSVDSLANQFVANGIGCGANYLYNSCLSEIQVLNYYGNHDGISVNLGTPFHLTYAARVESGGGGPSADNVYGRASLNMTISYQLFEADGVTPVEVLSDVPEPATWSLMAVPFVVALIRKRGNRNSRAC